MLAFFLFICSGGQIYPIFDIRSLSQQQQQQYLHHSILVEIRLNWTPSSAWTNVEWWRCRMMRMRMATIATTTIWYIWHQWSNTTGLYRWSSAEWSPFLSMTMFLFHSLPLHVYVCFKVFTFVITRTVVVATTTVRCDTFHIRQSSLSNIPL